MNREPGWYWVRCDESNDWWVAEYDLQSRHWWYGNIAIDEPAIIGSKIEEPIGPER